MYAMFALYAMFATFATPSGHTGCDSYETRHLHKEMTAGSLPWESDNSEDEVLLLYAVGNKRKRKCSETSVFKWISTRL
jgi:hypothetical protein